MRSMTSPFARQYSSRDVRHPPPAERRTLAFRVLEMTRGRGSAPNVRAANEWNAGDRNKRMGVWNLQDRGIVARVARE